MFPVFCVKGIIMDGWLSIHLYHHHHRSHQDQHLLTFLLLPVFYVYIQQSISSSFLVPSKTFIFPILIFLTLFLLTSYAFDLLHTFYFSILTLFVFTFLNTIAFSFPIKDALKSFLLLIFSASQSLSFLSKFFLLYIARVTQALLIFK